MSTDGSFDTSFGTFESQLQTEMGLFGEEEAQEEIQLFPEETLAGKRTRFDNEMAIRKATIGDDGISDYREALAKGGMWSASQILETAKEVSFSSLSTAIQEMPEPPAPEDISSFLDEEKARFNMETAPEWAWAEQLSGFHDLAEEEQRDVVANRYVARKISEIIEDQDLGDWTTNIAGLMLVPDESYNAAMFYRELTGSEKGLSNFAFSADKLLQIGDWFTTLSAQEKVDVLPILVQAAKDTDDNDLQQAFILMAATGQAEPSMERVNHLLDKSVVGGMAVGTVKRLMSLTSLPKTLAKTGNHDELAVIADSVARGEMAPEAAQIHALDATMTGTPNVTGDLAELLTTAPEGVSREVMERWAKMDALKEEGLDLIKGKVQMSPDEIGEVIRKEEDRLAGIPDIRDVTFKTTDSGLNIEYKVGDTLTQETRAFTQDDITGGFSQTQVGPISDILSGLVSPNTHFKDMADVLVQPFEMSALAQSKLKSRLTDTLRVATKDLKGNKESLKKVSDLLLRGTLKDELYTYQKAVNEGIGGFKLTDKEYSTYLNIRKLYDDMFYLKNDDIRTKLQFRNAKSVQLTNGQVGYPSVSETASDAWRKYELSNYKSVVDDTTGDILRLTREELDEAYEQGKVLTKLDNNSEFWSRGDTRTKLALVPREQVAELPEIVLQYRKGYTPLVYKDANFFVKQKRVADDLGDTPVTYQSTLRVFDNATDAEQWARGHAAREGLDFDRDMVVAFDREKMSDVELDEDIANMYGGFASSPRKQERLPFGLEGAEAEFVDPIETLQQYMFHVGNRVPTTELRLSLEQRWLNQAREFLGTQTKGGFNDLLGDVKNSTHGDERKKKLLTKSHEQIQTLNNVPTKDEQALQGKFISIGKSLEKKSPALKGFSKALYSLSHTSPVGAAKAATHHMLLGTGSIVQAPIQALGATVAYSINPVYASKATGKWLAFSWLDNITDPAMRSAKLKKLAKTKGMNLGDLEEAYTAWRKSGYRESVLQTNGDYAAMANGLPYDGNAVRRLFDKSAVFFKSGELANMRISFATAMERWKDLNKGKKVDDDAIREIVARAEQFRLNMSQGNRARFQKGIVSVPLQFQQINTKFIEATLGSKAFTTPEKAKLFTGQTLLFGSMGVPFGEAMLSYYMDFMDIDYEDMSAEELNARKRGLTGWLFNNQLGIDAEIAGRVAIPAGVIDSVTEMITEKHDLTALAGPTGAIAQRVWDGPVSAVAQAMSTTVNADELSQEELAGIAKNLVFSLGEVPSGTRNAILAWDLHASGYVMDSTGRRLWESDPKMRDILFQAVGFQSLTKAEYWDLIKSRKAQQMNEKAMVDRLARLYHRSMRFQEDDDEMGSRMASLTISALIRSVEDPVQANRLGDKLADRFKNDDQLRRLIEQSIKSTSDKASPSSMGTNLLLREGGLD